MKLLVEGGSCDGQYVNDAPFFIFNVCREPTQEEISECPALAGNEIVVKKEFYVRKGDRFVFERRRP